MASAEKPMQSGERIVINGRSYRLGSLLSTHAGSYGQVWAATDPTGRGVALKFINAEAMSRADPALHGHWRAHLEREIAFLACLDADQSQHVVALLDHGQTGGQPVLVMERLHANLGQWLTRQRRESALPPDLERVVDWTGQILDGLEVIHRAGFVYRDLKFSNILVDEGGWLLKLADFGSLSREDGDSTRSFIGTPATMAPEQVLPVRCGAAGSEYAIDYRADYYALGLLLFALLTDRPTTAAQRRLGQLLAQHGQEGAARYGEQLGGLDEEERELLRWSIEFWTVPARPEQARNGAAVLLTELIGRLLARDPAGRPTHGAEIRAVLAAASVGPANAATARPMAGEPLPAAPPNRRPRANGAGRSSPSAWSRRIVGLAGACGLAGALAWTVFIQPGDWLPTFSEPPGLALPAPDPAPIAEAESIPVQEPTVVTTTTPETEPAPEPAITAPEIVSAPPPAQPPAAKAPVAAPTLKAPVAAERSAPEPSRVPAPARTTTRPAPVERPASPPPPAPQVAKPTPKAAPAPTAAIPRSSPATAKAAPAPRSAGTAPATARATPSTPTATRPAAAPAPAPAANPVARVTPPASPALPPIELTSRPQSPPALPPIELTSRPQSPPPIELVSRSSARPAAQPAPAPIELISRPTAPPAQPQPPPRASSANPPASRPPARSSAPVTSRNTTDVDRVAAGVRREAEAFTDWVGRTSTTISKEVQRGLESANQALNPPPRGNNTRVERRDQQYRPRAD
ncbi:MAG: serine/threonine protein kinase [Candidatus Competibacteraceae bacterium]|nr:MAG: serine/threonine protein kinase [Candidatus Competibacteraceae bacterium]